MNNEMLRVTDATKWVKFLAPLGLVVFATSTTASAGERATFDSRYHVQRLDGRCSPGRSHRCAL
jgi:hypothetical protein